jgi:hypothetical protein
MNIHYRVVEVWPENHSIVVRYWTDIISEEDLKADDNRKPDGSPWRCRSDASLTLPVPAPTGEELHKMIKFNAPTAFLETLEKVADPNIDTSLSHISFDEGGSTTLKEVLDIRSPIPPEVTAANPNVLTDEEIQKLLDNIKK